MSSVWVYIRYCAFPGEKPIREKGFKHSNRTAERNMQLTPRHHYIYALKLVTENCLLCVYIITFASTFTYFFFKYPHSFTASLLRETHCKLHEKHKFDLNQLAVVSLKPNRQPSRSRVAFKRQVISSCKCMWYIKTTYCILVWKGTRGDERIAKETRQHFRCIKEAWART